MEMKIEKTKKGYPAMWERGGGYSNTGESVIIADSNGQAKKPVYVRRRGHLANGNHALFLVEMDDVVVMADHHREDFTISVLKIADIVEEEAIYTYELPRFAGNSKERLIQSFLEGHRAALKEEAQPLPDTYQITQSGRYHQIDYKVKETWAILDLVCEFSCDEWDSEPPAHLIAAIEAAKEKATCYHCREPHYIAE